jgi:hypothetical protein
MRSMSRGVSGVLASLFITGLVVMLMITIFLASTTFAKSYPTINNVINMEWEESNEKVVVEATRIFTSGIYFYEIKVTNVGSISTTITNIVLTKMHNFTKPYSGMTISPSPPRIIKPGESITFTTSVTDRDVMSGYVVTTRDSYFFTVKNIVLS